MNPVIMPAPSHDQATALRQLVSGRKPEGEIVKPERIEGLRTVAVLSGKGGIGKSNVAVNLGLALADLGLRVAILDADLGLANIDILFGVVPKFNIAHVLKGEKEFPDILLKVTERLCIIPGGVGIRELADLDEQQQAWMIRRLAFLEEETDILILDTGAGLHRSVLAFAMAADFSLLLTTPEPTAIRDSYGVLKSLYQAATHMPDIGLLVNMAADEREAELVAERITSAAEQFLGSRVEYVGHVLWDQEMREAVKKRRPLLLDDTDAISAPCFRRLAERVDATIPRPGQRREQRAVPFLKRLMRQMLPKEGH
jgi:ATPases involved in chromosome partitioning